MRPVQYSTRVMRPVQHFSCQTSTALVVWDQESPCLVRPVLHLSRFHAGLPPSGLVAQLSTDTTGLIMTCLRRLHCTERHCFVVTLCKTLDHKCIFPRRLHDEPGSGQYPCFLRELYWCASKLDTIQVHLYAGSSFGLKHPLETLTGLHVGSMLASYRLSHEIRCNAANMFALCRVKCWAFAPPGGLADPNVAHAAKDFCTSVVLGKDWIPRLTVHSFERLRDEMVSPQHISMPQQSCVL